MLEFVLPRVMLARGGFFWRCHPRPKSRVRRSGSVGNKRAFNCAVLRRIGDSLVGRVVLLLRACNCRLEFAGLLVWRTFCSPEQTEPTGRAGREAASCVDRCADQLCSQLCGQNPFTRGRRPMRWFVRAGALSFLKETGKGAHAERVLAYLSEIRAVASSKKKITGTLCRISRRIPHCRSRKWLPSQQRCVEARSKQQRPVIRCAVL